MAVQLVMPLFRIHLFIFVVLVHVIKVDTSFDICWPYPCSPQGSCAATANPTEYECRCNIGYVLDTVDKKTCHKIRTCPVKIGKERIRQRILEIHKQRQFLEKQ